METSFGELRTNNDFTDIALACEDQSIKAHKVVLSACSPFFKRLLKTHSHPQPLIYQRGIKSKDLVAIVDFIYLGEANIFQEQLHIFLSLAEELELKGLNGSSEEDYTKGSFAADYQGVPDVGIWRNRNEGTSVKFEDTFDKALLPIFRTKEQRSIEVNPDTMATIESMHNDLKTG